MDLSHSGWSDIFFLGMDLPERARVLNVSIDLGLHNCDAPPPKPPVEAYFRVIDRPILRLVSVDLDASAEIENLQQLFDFGRDYLGLLKAAVIASGLVPPGLESSGQPLARLLRQFLGKDGLGIEVVSHVNDIPKGSRLAVSTNLLASLISVCMRATGQAGSLTGPLTEPERRLVAARAILGEWLGGSGGGWQDSGGVWPGIKLIEGVEAAADDAEFGISRGRLLPNHRILSKSEVTEETRQGLQDSLVLVHGGMAQDVGPILEMVTERYLFARKRNGVAARKRANYWMRFSITCGLATCAGLAPPRKETSKDRFKRSSPGQAISTLKRSFRRLRRLSARRSGDSGCWAECQAVEWVLSSIPRKNLKRKIDLAPSCEVSPGDCGAGCRSPWSRSSTTSLSMNMEPARRC